MAVSVGRLRPDTQYDYKFVCLSHNTLRGAAGGAVLLAELLCAKGIHGLIPSHTSTKETACRSWQAASFIPQTCIKFRNWKFEWRCSAAGGTILNFQAPPGTKIS